MMYQRNSELRVKLNNFISREKKTSRGKIYLAKNMPVFSAEKDCPHYF